MRRTVDAEIRAVSRGGHVFRFYRVVMRFSCVGVENVISC